ncbi:MAG: DUF4082 domain-containing protein [Microbacteriaceae bacterium]|nr:DUF4082 domain-containing protein [Microbacteriaceae bacterium]
MTNSVTPSRAIALRRRRWRIAAAAAATVLVLGVSLIGFTPRSLTASATQVGVFFAEATPNTVTGQDPKAVTLGVKFSSAVGGVISGIRFYKGPENGGTHVGSLWSTSGKKLATGRFVDETATGWQTVTFSSPVRITRHTYYVASYFAPQGHYSADTGALDHSVRRGSLKIPAGGGVYHYGPKPGFPRNNYENSNYFVDIVFTSDGASAPESTTSPTPAPTPAATPTATPTPTPTATPTSQPVDPGQSSSFALPLIPWEGGSAYWKKFAKPTAAGWSDPSFFPIVSTFNGISSDEEVAYDKSLGFNTYTGMWEGTQYSLFKDNNVFWLGEKLNSSFTSSSTNWVGDSLGDEIDGRYTVADGQAFLRSAVQSYGDDGRFKYTNFTQIVMGTDIKATDAEQFVNGYTDAVSLDMYYYTIPYCSLTPYRDVYLTPVAQSNCRTSSSYGKTLDSLRIRDAADGKLQSLFGVVELVNGGPGGGPFLGNITPGQLKGSVINSIIHEARGIIYFNQSMSGSCASGNIIRETQVQSGFCAAPQVAAAKDVNLQIKSLAPVLNTQSYRYSFGSGLDTMLKVKDGYAYVFAMIDGASAPGKRTFTLPAGVSGRSIEVVGENRTIAASSAGGFTDQFSAEYSYHIYKIKQ